MNRASQIIAGFTKAQSPLPGEERRRVRLLAWLQISLLALLAIALAATIALNQSEAMRHTSYLWLIAGMGVVLLIALALNSGGYFHASSAVTVAAAVAAPWCSLLIDPKVLQVDLMPLSYVVFSVMLSAMLLRTWVTIVVATAQWLVLLGLMLTSTPTSLNWASLLTLVFFVSVISALYSVVSARDLRQIDRQTLQLTISAEELRELSMRDHLTTLYNRRYLEETLDLEADHADRVDASLGVIILDVDHFKYVNDSFGHVFGDEVLQTVGRLIAENVRTDDIACRFGGDEFILVLSDVELETAKHRAEVLLEEIRRLTWRPQKGRQPRVTATAGVAVFPEHGSSGQEVLQAADAALYRAKSQGRDQLVAANSIPPPRDMR